MINGYDIAYGLGVAVSAPVWGLRGKARRKVLRALSERMGRVEPRRGGGPAVMIHAVSLGEINATRSLVKLLTEARPDLHVIVSTTTDTGFARGQQLYGTMANVTLIRFPLDFSAAVSRILDRLRPNLVVLMELEVWPNFLLQCRRRNIPVIVINGRLTPHSLKRYRLIRPLARTMFSKLTAVAAQEEGYASQFVELGVPADRVCLTGTMKFDTAEITDRFAGAEELAAAVDLRPDEPLWVCGSTGPGEEEIILQAYREILKQIPTLRLAIIPRHPERFDEVAGIIESARLPLLRRSKPGQVASGSGSPVILGDTMGELRKFYSLAAVVLVGRTLLDLGSRQRGSDMIEPAALAKPTIVGPWTQNFAEVMNAFRATNAMREIDGGHASLPPAVLDLLQDPSAAAEMGKRAQDTVRQNKGATSRHADMILARLPKAC